MFIYIIHYYVDGRLVESYHPTRFNAEIFSRFAFTLSADLNSPVTLFRGMLRDNELIKLLCDSLNGKIVVSSVVTLRMVYVPCAAAVRAALMDAYIENKDEENDRIIQARGC